MSSSLELSEIVIDNGDRVRQHGESSGSPFYVNRGRLNFCSRGIGTQTPLCCRKILDPNEPFLRRLNKIFLISCVLALAWDPLFFYVPVMGGDKKCLSLDKKLAILACVLRTFTDLFYLLHIILQFHTGFVAPPSRVFGGPQIVMDQDAIAERYLSSYFIVDVLAVLPLPQMAVYVLIPNSSGKLLTSEDLLMFVIFTQYVPRVIRIYPLFVEVKRSSGLVTDTIWAGAAYNLFLYMLASHVIGSFWYLLAINRQTRCWEKSCLGQGCYHFSLYCKDRRGVDYAFNSSYCTLVDPGQIQDSAAFNSGLYFDALRSEMVVQSTQILRKISYCFWWGLRNLSSCGQNLETSSYLGENIFATLICVGGLILFALLIGNMQMPLFEMMSEFLKDTMCDRLKPVLYTKDCYIVREGYPVNEFHFITRGELMSITKNGGRTDFFDSFLKAGDFCGEELVTWALDPRSSSNLPISTRTIQSVTEVEAFALLPDDLKFVASQYRRLHSRHVRHIFRYYSMQWRTWAACFIQAAWRRYCRRLKKSLQEAEEDTLAKEGKSSSRMGAAIYALRIVINALHSLQRNREDNSYAILPQHSTLPLQNLQKPDEPNFTSEDG